MNAVEIKSNSYSSGNINARITNQEFAFYIRDFVNEMPANINAISALALNDSSRLYNWQNSSRHVDRAQALDMYALFGERVRFIIDEFNARKYRKNDLMKQVANKSSITSRDIMKRVNGPMLTAPMINGLYLHYRVTNIVKSFLDGRNNRESMEELSTILDVTINVVKKLASGSQKISRNALINLIREFNELAFLADVYNNAQNRVDSSGYNKLIQPGEINTTTIPSAIDVIKQDAKFDAYINNIINVVKVYQEQYKDKSWYEDIRPSINAHKRLSKAETLEYINKIKREKSTNLKQEHQKAKAEKTSSVHDNEANVSNDRVNTHQSDHITTTLRAAEETVHTIQHMQEHTQCANHSECERKTKELQSRVDMLEKLIMSMQMKLNSL